ncbi:MAG TPA: hypothetical protein VI911_11095 [Patescibacteria group bacterium]|nr:hypothetical protein [Patescibacteria group bacterium]
MSKQRVNFSTYPQDYFCGAQVRIYFGSIYVDDIATIQYQTSHSKTPLYGYGDHQFRTIAKGQLLVRGSFTIAFKETGYLYSIIQLMRADKAGLELISKSKDSFETYMKYIGNGLTPEQALDYTANNKTTNQVFGTDFKDSADFEDISEVLEDAIWGKPGTPAFLQSRIPRSDELDYLKYTQALKTSSDIDRDGFDILLTFGSYREGIDTPDHTIVSINDVHITGESMVVSPSAEPIGLTCEFFARGINERISNAFPVADVKVAEAAKEEAKAEPEKAAEEIESKKDDTPQQTEEPNPNMQGPPNLPGSYTPSSTMDICPDPNDDNTQVVPTSTTEMYGPSVPLPIQNTGILGPTNEQIKEYIKTKKRLEKDKQVQEILDKEETVVPVSPSLKSTPLPKLSGKDFMVGPLKGNKNAIFSKAKIASKDYKSTFLTAKLTLSGSPDRGNIHGKASPRGPWPWLDIEADYTLYNENTLVFTNVQTKIPISTLKSAMNDFFSKL